MPPQLPFGGMGSRMMGSGFGGSSPMMGMNRMFRPPMMGPMMGGGPQMNRGGGLLARLLGRGNPGGAMNGFMGMPQAGAGAARGLMGMPQAGSAAGGGSFLQSLSNPGGLSGFLNNTQQVIRTVQSIGPMVQQFQQYSSLIRNIPAMWKLYQGLKNSSNDTAEESKQAEESSTNPNKENSSSSSKRSKQNSSASRKKNITSSKPNKGNHRKNQADSTSYEKGASVPKLYI